MANYSEETITSWTRPPSDSEESKLANSERRVREAISGDSFLSKKTVKVLGQGSYANDTNVRLNSDIDINVRLDTDFYFKLPKDRTREEFGLVTPPITLLKRTLSKMLWFVNSAGTLLFVTINA